MAKIKLLQSGNSKTVSVDEKQSLLDVIRSNRFKIPAPCGGKGSCGKCRVHIKDVGKVLSCSYFPKHDIEVYLPDERESQILTDQYEYAFKIPLAPGIAGSIDEKPFGIAVDIGTTTVATYFYNLNNGNAIGINGEINSQASYGADVISRIQYCAQPGGLLTLQAEITGLVNRQIETFIKRYRLKSGQIVKIVFSGNTTMLHLLLAENPASIAMAPFTPVFTGWKYPTPAMLNLSMNPHGIIELIPSISGYVGADIVAGLASLAPPKNIRNYLFLDIGTNGEIALVLKDKILTCATAAGPAFEGANISCGMGATEGAISTYSGPGKYTIIGNDTPKGICGSGLIDIAAYMVKEKIVAEDGLLREKFLISDIADEVYMTQEDIRELQLAKAAIFAGIKTILKIAELDFDDLDALFLAGGFGNYINIENAAIIGLLPAELNGKTISVGNTSGTGASILLKSEQFKKTIDRIVQNTEYIELSGNDDFVIEYAMNMNFPVWEQC